MAAELITHILRPILPLAAAMTRRQLLWQCALGGALSLLALLPVASMLQITLWTSGLALCLLALLVATLKALRNRVRTQECQLVAQLFARAEEACLLADARDDSILWANDSAVGMFELDPDASIAAILSAITVNPHDMVSRLHDKALATGAASHQFQTGAETHLCRLQQLSDMRVLWQITRQEQADPRDRLSAGIVQFHADGTLDFASAAIVDALGHCPRTAADLCATALPAPGCTAPAATALARLGENVLHLQDDHGGGRSFLLLPRVITDTRSDPSLLSGQDALQTLPVAIACLNARGEMTFLNQEARRVLHWTRADTPLISDLLEGLGRPVMEWLADVAEGRLQSSREVLRLNRGTKETFLKVTLSRQQSGPGTGEEVLAVLSDVTELKSLEAKFTQSQKMQAIGQLAGGVAHDFNNLLTAISGHCDLLLLRHDRSDLDYPDLMQIQQNTNRAAALVRQLLALSRQQTLRFVTLDLQETMDDVIHLLNRLVGEKITLTLHHGSAVAPIRSDKRQFEQILMNLVVNARDALPMGGEIRIETETVALPQGMVQDDVSLAAGTYTVIRIKDDGVGIPRQTLPKIFDPFFTTKRQGEGTGLGLSTVYGIVKQSGGYIFAESEEGVGTTFTLYFAALDEAPEAVPEPRVGNTVTPTMKSRRALVLLVEDEAPVRSFAARALELQGHRVIEADCGETALDILANPEIRPDFFITDVIMPGLDGPGWVAEVRDRFPDTPVLFMSGYAEDSRVAAQARISNASFLGKPFSLAEFTATVNNQMQSASVAA